MTTRLILLLSLVALVGAIGELAHGRSPADDWSPVIYPAQRMPLIFSHMVETPNSEKHAPETRPT